MSNGISRFCIKNGSNNTNCGKEGCGCAENFVNSQSKINQSNMEIQGKIIMDLPLLEGVSKAGNPWKKKEWVLETTNVAYPRKVKFDVFGDRVDNFKVQVGREYIIRCDVESREFNGRWYTDVHGISYTEVGSTPAAAAAPAASFPTQQVPAGGAPDFTATDDSDDLPF